jgi:phosphotransferase system HPr-like phosphotransfer protein
MTLDLHKIIDRDQFFTLAQLCKGDITAQSETGNRILCAKSLLGLMSLNLNNPIIVKFENKEDENMFNRFEVLKEN